MMLPSCVGPEGTVQSTGIKQHLEQMADLLCQEEEEKDPRDPGAMVCVAL